MGNIHNVSYVLYCTSIRNSLSKLRMKGLMDVDVSMCEGM